MTTTAAFILIVSSYISGYASGYTSTTFQEFSTAEKCRFAVSKLSEWSKNDKNLLIWCVEK